jgi:hypothetical protein
MEHLQCKKCGNRNQMKIFYTKTPTGMIKASCEICKSYIKFVSKRQYAKRYKVSNSKIVGGKHLQHSKSFQKEMMYLNDKLDTPKLF